MSAQLLHNFEITIIIVHKAMTSGKLGVFEAAAISFSIQSSNDDL